MRSTAEQRFDELKAEEVRRIQIEEPDLDGLSSTQKQWLREHVAEVNAKIARTLARWAKEVPETDFGVHVADLQLQAAAEENLQHSIAIECKCRSCLRFGHHPVTRTLGDDTEQRP